jgi:predicted TIM-barrel fold metal-dependent hydrolase
MNRREFLAGTVALAATSVFSLGATKNKKDIVIDSHTHLSFRASPADEGDERLVLDAADKLGIDQLCCSILPKRPATVEGFQAANRVMAAAHKRHPDRFLGYCFVNPGCGQAAVDEIRRCLDLPGFIGVKLYNEHRCTDPIVFPVIEQAIELRVPILHHAGHSHYPVKEQPNISDGGRLAELAKRYPEARLICAHIGGGGDWEWTIKALRHAKTVYLDTSGSVIDEAMVDMAVKVLTADRLLFGCDMSWTAGIGKIRAAKLSAEERRKILGGNMQRLLAQRARQQ